MQVRCIDAAVLQRDVNCSRVANCHSSGEIIASQALAATMQPISVACPTGVQHVRRACHE